MRTGVDVWGFLLGLHVLSVPVVCGWVIWRGLCLCQMCFYSCFAVFMPRQTFNSMESAEFIALSSEGLPVSVPDSGASAIPTSRIVVSTAAVLAVPSLSGTVPPPSTQQISPKIKALVTQMVQAALRAERSVSQATSSGPASPVVPRSLRDATTSLLASGTGFPPTGLSANPVSQGRPFVVPSIVSISNFKNNIWDVQFNSPTEQEKGSPPFGKARRGCIRYGRKYFLQFNTFLAALAC